MVLYKITCAQFPFINKIIEQLSDGLWRFDLFHPLSYNLNTIEANKYLSSTDRYFSDVKIQRVSWLSSVFIGSCRRRVTCDDVADWHTLYYPSVSRSWTGFFIVDVNAQWTASIGMFLLVVQVFKFTCQRHVFASLLL